MIPTLPNNNIHTQTRARCPMCEAEMVYAAFIVEGLTIWTWLCSCQSQPDFMLMDIANARLDPLITLIYELEIATNEPVGASTEVGN